MAYLQIVTFTESQFYFYRAATFLVVTRNHCLPCSESKDHKADYQEVEGGKHQFHLWESFGTKPDWEAGSLNLYGDSTKNYYMEITEGSGNDDSFVSRLAGGTKIEGRFGQYYERSDGVTLTLTNQRRVHSSHPVELSPQYPFYDESRRHSSRINPDAMYP